MDTFTVMDSKALTVSVVGTNISTTINGGGEFTLSGVPSGTVQLKFSGSGVDAMVTIAGVTASDHIDITVRVNGGTARVESERRGRGNGNGDNDEDELDDEVNGVVAALGGACPTLTFMVQGTRVTTNSATVFDDTACARVVNGMVVEVHGVRQADGSLLASRIEAEDDDDDDDVRDARVELEGAIASMGGTCPAVTLTVQGTRVTTSNATRFDDGTCGTLQNGTQVEVEGQRQADGSVSASRIEVKTNNRGPNPGNTEQRFTGSVSGVGGACPAITFMVQGNKVATNSSTRFDDTSCGRVANSMRVEVRGLRQTDGSVLASRVKREDDDD
jgi:hypothetical protein